MHYLREDTVPFQRDEEVLFEGFEVAEENATDASELHGISSSEKAAARQKDEDERMFFPFEERGRLIFASPQRLLAETARPLPEGLCGGPVFDRDDKVAGVVEGIVPLGHEDERLRGAASFLPSPVVREFVQWAERQMLERIVPERLFEKVCRVKEGLALNDEGEKVDVPSKLGNAPGVPLPHVEEGEVSNDPDLMVRKAAKLGKAYDEMVVSLKKNHSKEEVEAILNTIEREREEVVDMMKTQGGELDDVISKVRRRTMEMRAMLLKQNEEEQAGQETTAQGGGGI